MKSYIKLLWFIFFIVLLFINGCKKDKYTGPQGPEGPAGPTGNFITVNPAVYGKWSFVEGPLGHTKYIVIKNNNVFYFLDSLEFGFKNFERELAFFTYNQMYLWGSIYNYSFSNDTLKFISQYDKLILKRNDNAPEPEQWVTFVNVVDYIENPDTNGYGRLDIGFDGTNILWTGSINTNKIYKINPSTHTVSFLNLPTSYYYASVNYANSFIWITNGDKIDKIDPATGTVISSSLSLGFCNILSLALDGNLMYIGNSCPEINTWNIVSNTITNVVNYWAKGLEFVNGYLYIINNGFIYKCQVNPTFKVLNSYYVNSIYTTFEAGGITYDGAKFWVVGKNPYTYRFLLLKLDL